MLGVFREAALDPDSRVRTDRHSSPGRPWVTGL